MCHTNLNTSVLLRTFCKQCKWGFNWASEVRTTSTSVYNIKAVVSVWRFYIYHCLLLTILRGCTSLDTFNRHCQYSGWSDLLLLHGIQDNVVTIKGMYEYFWLFKMSLTERQSIITVVFRMCHNPCDLKLYLSTCFSDRMQLTNQSRTPVQSEGVYPTSRTLLPPTPVYQDDYLSVTDMKVTEMSHDFSAPSSKVGAFVYVT